MIFPLESIDLEAMVQRLTVFCSEIPTCLWRVGKHRNVVSWSQNSFPYARRGNTVGFVYASGAFKCEKGIEGERGESKNLSSTFRDDLEVFGFRK